MTKKPLLKTGFAAAATLSLLMACGPAPTASKPSASATPAASPSAAPTAAPSAAVSAAPSAAPSVAPTPAPSANASAAPTAAPSAAATATPLPAATSDISVVEKTTFNGKVFDDTEAPLDGVKVSVKSLNSSVPFSAETTTAGGTYSFNNAPSGVQIEITASKPGYTTRRRVEVLKSNKQGDPNANRYDFGSDGGAGFGSSYTALSDKPEVIMVTPGRNASGVDPKTSFVLKFSEPMDRDSVESSFSVHVFEDQQFSIDTANQGQAGLSADFTGPTTVANGVITSSNPLVWDESDFNFSWNSDDTEVTASFNYEKLLPTDKDSANVPDYLVSFMNGGAGTLKDKSGILRNMNWFKLTEGDFEAYSKFAIKTDEVKPGIQNGVAASAEGGSLRGDAVKLFYTERMLIDTKYGDVGANNSYLNSDGNMDPLNASNYTLLRNKGGVQMDTYSWSHIGGSVVFDADDLTRKSVLLTPPVQGTLSSTVADPPISNRAQVPGMSFLLADGSIVTPTPNNTEGNGGKYFRNTGSAQTSSTPGTNGVAATAGGDVATVDFFYTDGTAETNVATPDVGANCTAANLQTQLNSLMTGTTGWTVSDSNGANLGDTDTVTLSLTTTAQRGGKNVSAAVVRLSGAFATTKLGGGTLPAGGYLVVGNITESLSTLLTAAAPATVGDQIAVDFFYTDGVVENDQISAAITSNDATGIQTALTNMLSQGSFNVAVSDLGSGNTAAIDAGERYHIGISNNAIRSGRSVAFVRIDRNFATGISNAFATGKLNSSTGWVLRSEYEQVQHLLNNYLNLGVAGGQFTVSETNAAGAGNTAGAFNTNDTLTLSLGANPVSINGQRILAVHIPRSPDAGDGFASNALNAPANGFLIYQNTTVGNTVDLFQPADQIKVTVSASVVDPAGNTLDSKKNDVSVTAG